MVWRVFPPEAEDELRAGLKQRFAARYCLSRPESDLQVDVEVRISRVTADMARSGEEPYRPVMRFTCNDGSAAILEAR